MPYPSPNEEGATLQDLFAPGIRPGTIVRGMIDDYPVVGAVDRDGDLDPFVTSHPNFVGMLYVPGYRVVRVKDITEDAVVLLGALAARNVVLAQPKTEQS